MKTHGRTQAHDCIGMEATGTKIPGEPEHTSYRYCLLGALTERARDLHEHDERDFPIRPPRAKVRNTLRRHSFTDRYVPVIPDRPLHSVTPGRGSACT